MPAGADVRFALARTYLALGQLAAAERRLDEALARADGPTRRARYVAQFREPASAR